MAGGEGMEEGYGTGGMTAGRATTCVEGGGVHPGAAPSGVGHFRQIVDERDGRGTRGLTAKDERGRA